MKARAEVARKHPGVLAACLLAYRKPDDESVDAQVGALVTAEWMLSQMQKR